MGVGEDVAFVDRDPQPQSIWPRRGLVVGGEPGGEVSQQWVQQGGGWDCGIEQDQDPVAEVAASGDLGSRDLGGGQGVVEQRMQVGAELGPLGVGPVGLAEPFDVEGEDPSPLRCAAHPPSCTIVVKFPYHRMLRDRADGPPSRRPDLCGRGRGQTGGPGLTSPVW